MTCSKAGSTGPEGKSASDEESASGRPEHRALITFSMETPQEEHNRGNQKRSKVGTVFCGAEPLTNSSALTKPTGTSIKAQLREEAPV